MVESYLAGIIQELTVNYIVSSFKVLKRAAGEEDGYIRIKCGLSNGDIMEFAEYIQFNKNKLLIETYSYHWQSADGKLIEILEKKHAILVTEFDRYVVEHPEFAAKIPQNAQIILQIEGDEEYNNWSKRLAEKQREPGQAVVYVRVKGLKPAKSSLIKPELALA